MIATPRWKDLAAAGAAPQRLLWASTGVKDPTFSDVLYVEELVGPDTVDTMQVKTLDALRDNGRVRPSLTEGLDEAKEVLASAKKLGLDLDRVTAALAVEGGGQFSAAFARLSERKSVGGGKR